ncbi:hypothetical protein HOY80DRAFT_1087668 [Tuber brumale]|nr:hypothetical protein HOY80DRAFT_1087668 [Tuber brumale]
MGSIERWAVPQSLGELKSRDARKSGLSIKDPHGDGVSAIAKDKTTTFLKAKNQVKEAGKAAGLQRKRDARESHLEIVRVHKKRERGCRRRQWRGMGPGRCSKKRLGCVERGGE